MPFRKNNKIGAKKFLSKPLDAQPICFKGYQGQKEQLKTIPNWQERVRNFIDELIQESTQNGKV
ncbi:MAG: hypothetical protein F6K21_01140 [Symploca sp. SIO2D2]|nr:hypothetical protein [Symploca sp. SIO2D2]NER45348.1 hypothetical protein [Symploca sp. SIO1A3]